MQIGQKIKAARKKQGLTQEQLAGKIITRNMLSKIENGVANPSFDTLKYLAEQLGLPFTYLCSNDDDIIFYEKKEIIEEIYLAYSAKKYSSCIQRAKRLSRTDSEIAYILCDCHYKEGLDCLKRGSLNSALRNFEACESYSKETVIDTNHILVGLPMYKAICKNVNAPLLEFDPVETSKFLLNSVNFEYIRYLSGDLEYNYENQTLKHHVEAKKLIKARDYKSAISILITACDFAKSFGYDAYTVFSIYSDLENCYKQLYDFEKAYLYASKKLSLIEGFKS